MLFQDFENGRAKQKAGYVKIKLCGTQAAKDGLKYFWVDTCCINKKDAVELSEAINSMFRWYREASKCYVYLADVSGTNSSVSKSKWFTRGWTLQELIAPASVEFFSSDARRLGDKRSLEAQIASTTRIPVEALRGHTLSQFNVAERMSWAEHRNTKKSEDQAYCLLGIFDVFMPLIYGEGRKAFSRLVNEINNSSPHGQ